MYRGMANLNLLTVTGSVVLAYTTISLFASKQYFWSCIASVAAIALSFWWVS